MNTIGKVIFDALAGRRSVVLPDVGSLEVKRRKAKKISETRIIPPQNVVIFTPDELEGAASAVDLLVAGGAAREDAQTQYRSWLEGARTDGGIVIDGVGEVKEGKMVVGEELHTALNPAKEEDVVTVEKERRKSPLWAWLLSGILLAALLFGVLWCWKKGCFECKKDRQPAAVEVVATPVTEPAGEDVVTEAVHASAPEPRFHVIAGSFSVESNADNRINELRRDFPELTVTKVHNPRNGYNMVSIFSAPTERQAYNKMNMYWDVDLYLWVYEEK